MQYRTALVAGALVLAGCGDSTLFPIQGDWRVTTLRELPAGVEPVFIDLNENGQALWQEDDQAILWDNGEVREVPVGSYLGPDGQVVGRVDGTAAVWRNGELTMLTGIPSGVLEDGTIYLARNDTMFTWRTGVLEATGRPVGLVGPEGRIWASRDASDPPYTYSEECGFYQDGEWHGVFSPEICSPILAEANGWALAQAAGGINPNVTVMHPEVIFQISPRDRVGSVDAAHVNEHGDAISVDGIVQSRNGERTDLWEDFDSLRAGAINGDGEILAEFRGRVILLTPRS